MDLLAAIPVLGVLLMLQVAIFSRLPLLQGTADIVLVALAAWVLQERVKTGWHWTVIAGLFVSFVSGLPFFVPIAGYLIMTGFAKLLHRRVWQVPILAMFLTVLLGTLVVHGLSIAALIVEGVPLGIQEGLSLVTLPSALLNLLLSLPVYVLISDLANWIYPGENE